MCIVIRYTISCVSDGCVLCIITGGGTVRWTDMNMMLMKMMMKLTIKNYFLCFSRSQTAIRHILLGRNWARDIKLKTSRVVEDASKNTVGCLCLFVSHSLAEKRSNKC